MTAIKDAGIYKYLEPSPEAEARFRAAVVRWLERSGYIDVASVRLVVDEDGSDTTGYSTSVDLEFRAYGVGRVTIRVGPDDMGTFIGGLL